MLRYINIFFGFFALVMFFSCATPGSPQGGPKDETPPQTTSASPENFSRHFQAKTITVRFDENITLNNLNQQLTVSPPMAKPEITSNNRTLSIRLKDSLRANSTYVISFGDALVDFNEGNISPNFQYVFSTGETIDSLSVVGEVLDAYTLLPVKDVGIALLNNLEDLSSKTEKPVYIAKTNANGLFQANYLNEGCYFLTALKDGNNDWTYDSLQEDVAFLRRCVRTKVLTKPVFPDSCSTSDSLAIVDSIQKFYQSGQQLLMFKQELPQGVSKSEFTANAVISVEFRNAVKQPEFQFLQPEITTDSFHIRWDKTQQKAEIFLMKQGINNVLLLAKDGDFSDTLKILNTKVEEPLKPVRVSLASGSSLAFFDTLKLAFDAPVRELRQPEDSLFWLNIDKDTIPVLLTQYSFNENRTQLLFDLPLQQKTSYMLQFPDSLFFDYLGQKNPDTMRLRFTTTSPETYARLTVRLMNKPAETCLLQILNEKLDVLEQREMPADSVSFTTLMPGKYRIRLILDRNQNGRWDSGNLREKRLPEVVYILPKTLSLEADWDFIEEWTL